MSASVKKTCLVIGATGAQGIPVIKALTSDGAYKVIALTRSLTSSNAQLLASLPNVTLSVGDSYSEPDLTKALNWEGGVDLAFVNTNGLAVGEMREIYWGIRIFELARQAGVKHYVWGGLDYASKKAGYDPKFKSAHYDGKGKVTDWISAQPTTPMNWSVLTSGPYIEMLSEMMKPQKSTSDPTYVFSAPLGEGAIAFVHVEDLGLYARWIFDHPEESRGLDLEIAMEHVHFDDLAKTFTEITGKPARYEPISLEAYFASGIFDPDALLGGTNKGDKTLATFQQNFSGFWNIWAASGKNEGLIKRDYAVLDKILPGRVKSVGEWMRKTGYTGEAKDVLKQWKDLSRA